MASGSDDATLSGAPAGAPPGTSDSVIAAWMAMDGLMQRCAGGRILEVDQYLSRQTVVDNAEILEPVFRPYGSSSRLECLNVIFYIIPNLQVSAYKVAAQARISWKILPHGFCS